MTEKQKKSIIESELLAFLAKAPSGWFPKSRQGSPNS